MRSCPAKASAVVYPRSKEVLSWQAAGFQASGSSYRGVKDAVPWLKELTGPHNKSMQRDLQTWVMADLILSILYLVF